VPATDLPNRVIRDRRVQGEEAYVYGLKARARRHHCLGYGTFSVELDDLESLRKQYCRTVRPITAVPIYLKAAALAIQRNPEANAILFKKPMGLRITQFEQVDVNLPITRRLDGRRVTFVGTIRGAAAKPLEEIQRELVEYQRGRAENSFAIRRIRRFARMPLWMARFVHWRMTRSPVFYIRNVGTCGVTFLEGGAYERLFPIAPTSVVFGIGAAGREPVVRQGAIVIRRMLKCSLMIDNFVISGLTAARLAADFKRLLEDSAFLREEMASAGRAHAIATAVAREAMAPAGMPPGLG
jgi:pyruvate/2-oxoglutarate dehydrogenase complex dihydrolipoamide acyltransferase (E2) component